MWLRNDGFFLAELLLSLSAWLIATSILLPLSIFLIGQSVQLRQEADALHYLFDRLQQFKFNNEILIDDSVEKNGTVFIFKVIDHGPDSAEEVCVKFVSYFEKEISTCALAE